MSQLRLLVDTDAGVDDAVALVLALRSPSVSVETITTVAGNTDADQSVRNVRYVLELCGREIPVHAGAGGPLVRRREFAAAHGGDGLGDLGLRPRLGSATPGSAAAALAEITAHNPGQLTLVTLAPLTNIALALHLSPSFATDLVRLVVMGGAANTLGNVSASAEFNIWSDPEAAQAVFQSGLPITMVGVEHSRGEAAHSPEDVARLRAIGTPYAGFVARMCAASAGRAVRNERPGFAGLPDAIAMAVALDTSLILRSDRCFVAVETRGQLTDGETVVDRLGRFGRPANAEVVDAVDAARYKQMVRDACG